MITLVQVFWSSSQVHKPHVKEEIYQSIPKHHVHQLGLNTWGFHHCSLLEHTLGRHMCLLELVHGPCQEWTEWLLLPQLQVGGASCYWFSCPIAMLSVWWSIQPWGLSIESPNSFTFPTCWQRSSFTGCVPPYDTVDFKSVVPMKPGDSGVVIAYQVGKFTSIWLVEHFIAQWHTYPDFMVEVLPLTHFQLEQGCEDYSFLDQAVSQFGLDSVLTDSINTLELDASFDEANTVLSSVPLGFLNSVAFLIILDYSLILALNLISYGASLGHYFCLYHRQVKCQPLSWFCYFSSHPTAFGFQASLSPDNITLNLAIKETNQSVSDF